LPTEPEHPYVSRGGVKLRHALDEFGFDVVGLRAADLGASVGGFTDCLLQAGAELVVSVDTAYGQFAWKLRNDPRVALHERTNALHAVPPEGGVDLVVMDLGWTPQRLCVPVALRWLRQDERRGACRIITLIKPHYEASDSDPTIRLEKGVLEDAVAERVAHEVCDRMPALGARVLGVTRSPIVGSKGKSKGNAEWSALLAPIE